MARSHRFQIMFARASTACVLVVFPALALAQTRRADVECKKTETQAECHARLKCKPDEELEDCQKRLLKCRANEKLGDCKKRVGAPSREGNAEERDDADREADNERGRDRDDAERDRGDRDRDDDTERGERWDRDDDADRGRADRRGRDDGARARRRRGARRGEGDRGGRAGGGSGFQANKTFGLGLELGEPSGLNGKYFLSENGALDFGIGWIYEHYYYDDGLHLYADYLYHPISLASADAFELPLYIGGGLRYWDFEYCDPPVCYDGSALGLRIPVGISFDFNSVPLDIFLQVVPVIDFLFDDYYDRYGDRAHVGVDVSVGFRFWFM